MNFRISAVLIMLIAGCSSDGAKEKFITGLGSGVFALAKPTAPITAPTGKPYIVISYGEASTPMEISSSENERQTYRSPDDVEMLLFKGYLARLRGLGQELEAIQTDGEFPDLVALASGNVEVHQWERRLDYWVDQGIKTNRFQCQFSRLGASEAGIAVTEKCISIYSSEAFDNFYLIDSSGRLTESIQWFHPDAEQLAISHILRGAGTDNSYSP